MDQQNQVYSTKIQDLVQDIVHNLESTVDNKANTDQYTDADAYEYIIPKLEVIELEEKNKAVKQLVKQKIAKYSKQYVKLTENISHYNKLFKSQITQKYVQVGEEQCDVAKQLQSEQLVDQLNILKEHSQILENIEEKVGGGQQSELRSLRQSKREQQIKQEQEQEYYRQKNQELFDKYLQETPQTKMEDVTVTDIQFKSFQKKKLKDVLNVNAAQKQKTQQDHIIREDFDFQRKESEFTQNNKENDQETYQEINQENNQDNDQEYNQQINQQYDQEIKETSNNQEDDQEIVVQHLIHTFKDVKSEKATQTEKYTIESQQQTDYIKKHPREVQTDDIEDNRYTKLHNENIIFQQLLQIQRQQISKLQQHNKQLVKQLDMQFTNQKRAQRQQITLSNNIQKDMYQKGELYEFLKSQLQKSQKTSKDVQKILFTQ